MRRSLARWAYGEQLRATLVRHTTAVAVHAVVTVLWVRVRVQLIGQL